MTVASPELLVEFLGREEQVLLLTGAGCSVNSGIPEYRDDQGRWKHSRPVQYADFLRDERVRRRYWARSYAGWPRIAAARPNGAHDALARLQASGHIGGVVTQNVDNLHQRAGSRDVIDLHGNLERVRCLSCEQSHPRAELQETLEALNPGWHAVISAFGPDGDAAIEAAATEDFRIVACRACGGVLKPDVVFFGEAVPAVRVRRARERLAASSALLVVGSSLMVWSGFRFARMAVETGKPVFIVNRGTTRADDIATVKLVGDCAAILDHAAARLQ